MADMGLPARKIWQRGEEASFPDKVAGHDGRHGNGRPTTQAQLRYDRSEVVPEVLKPLLVIRHQTLDDSVTAATPDLAGEPCSAASVPAGSIAVDHLRARLCRVAAPEHRRVVSRPRPVYARRV